VKADLDGAVIKQQISIIENGVNISSKRYNELKATNSALTSALKIKLDQLKEEKKNYEDMDALLKVRSNISKFVVCYEKRSEVTMTMCY
jgi:hypothetical protein